MNRTCAKCGHIKVDADMSATERCPECDVVMSKASILAATAKRQPTAPPSGPARTMVPLPTVIAVFVALAVGYVAGREHLKYEISSGLNAAAAKFSEGLKGIGANPPKPTPTPSPVAAEIDSPLSATLTEKTFREQDFSARPPVEDAIIFAIVVSNHSDKPVRAFNGVLTFTDLLGTEIYGAKISISDPIDAHGSITWQGELHYNQFVDKHRRLRDTRLADAHVVLRTSKILYQDGTSETLE